MFLSILPENVNIPPRMASRHRSNEQPSPDPAAFRTQHAEDIFLTGATIDPEQLVPEMRQTYRASGEPHPLARDLSGASSGHLTSPATNQDWLSPSTDNSYVNLSDYSSPDYNAALFLQPDFSFGADLDTSLQQPENETQSPGATAGLGDGQSTKRTTISTISTGQQLLSPVLTNTPSPRSDNASQLGAPSVENGLTNSPLSMANGRDPGRHASALPPPALNLPGNSTSNLEDKNIGENPLSPVVWVSRYSRGDSPTRESQTGGRSGAKRTRNLHLSPGQGEEASDSEPESPTNTTGGHRKTVSVPVAASRNNQGSWLTNPFTGQKGIDPNSRGDSYVISPKEMLERHQLETKNAEVETWLSTSEVDDNGRHGLRSLVPRKFSVKSRRRARSTGDSAANRRPAHVFDDSRIPGPGALIEEESEDEEDEGDTSSQLSDATDTPPARPNNRRDSQIAPSEPTDSEEEDVLPPQFTRPKLWKDPLRSIEVYGSPTQPATANAAMMKYEYRAKNIETASRTATCGMSDYDVESILGRDGIGNLSIGGKDKKKSRKNSILSRASGFWPIRSNSNAKRKTAEPVEQQTTADSLYKSKTNDTTEGHVSPSILSRSRPSFSRPSKPQINTSSAVAAMAGQIAAVGGGASATSPISGSSPLNHRRRSRSKSDVSNAGSLMDLMASHGGPPIPTLASPHRDRPTSSGLPHDRPSIADKDEDSDDDDDVMDDKGFVMEFPVRTELIVPNLEGFRTQVQQLNPRLQPALVERIAQEQVRRYRKLVELKTKHAHAVHRRTCTSAKFCFDLGGDATYLPPRTSPKDPDSTYGQFQVQPLGSTEELGNGFGEGAVVAALFPPGVPLPPVKSLPAEFECSLCFKVKKFQKPSDWTKHVHEDLQPFTCTFPQCNEPKSFKRKADWVRHESERHRQLEWWRCNMLECPHICYRKDNFVQHLVREHKMPDPKAKAARTRPTKSSKPNSDNQDASQDPAMDELWRRVDECHHFTDKQPRDEACRFCGNVCNSWKKLTVHMAKHMEQIAMPVLELVRQVKVPGGPTITPIENDSYDYTHYLQQHQQQQQQQRHQRDSVTHLSTHTTPRPRAVPNVPIYSTGTLLATAFGVSENPVSSRHLRAQNALNSMPVSPSGPVSPAPGYPVSSYSHSSATLHPNGREQGHFTGRANSATYPPPNNPLPRHQQGMREMVQVQPPTTGMPYNLDINAAVQTSAFDNAHTYASPDANLAYGYPQSAGQESARHPFVYQANNMEYTHGQMGNGNGYMQYSPGS